MVRVHGTFHPFLRDQPERSYCRRQARPAGAGNARPAACGRNVQDPIERSSHSHPRRNRARAAGSSDPRWQARARTTDRTVIMHALLRCRPAGLSVPVPCVSAAAGSGWLASQRTRLHGMPVPVCHCRLVSSSASLCTRI